MTELWAPGVSSGSREPFNDHSEIVEITPAERDLGEMTLRFFRTNIQRAPLWSIDFKNRMTVINRPLRGERRVQLPYERSDSTSYPQLRLEALEQEEISPYLVRDLLYKKDTEDFLPDFTRHSKALFRNLWGITRAYDQWGYEEGQHSDVLEIILESQGYSRDELFSRYFDNLSQTWELPFTTPRQITAYAAFQEGSTQPSYQAAAERADKEDAPVTAELLRLIGRDEGYHWASYIGFLRIFFGADPEGTIGDTIHVARQFRMPAINLIPEHAKGFVNAMRLGTYTPDMETEAIYSTLVSFGFIGKKLARQTADEHRDLILATTSLRNHLPGNLNPTPAR